MSRAGLIRLQGPFPRALAVVFLAGLALRLAYLFEISGDVLHKYPILDEGLYYGTAQRIAAGETVPGPYWRPPGLYFALAAILKTAGPGPFAPRLVQTCSFRQ